MTTIDEQELFIEECRAKIALQESLTKLRNTPEWKSLITELYCDKEMKADIMMLSVVSSEEGKKKFFDKITAVSHFQRFLEKVILEGEQAKASLYQLAEQNKE